MAQPSRMLFSSLFVFFAFLTVPVTTLSQGAGSPPVIIRFSGTAPFRFFNDCTGENVSGIVAFTGQIIETITPSGRNHFDVHQAFLGKANGETTGIQYVGPETIHESQVGGGLPFNDTFTQDFRFISKGSSSNLKFTEVFHITVNARGEATVIFDKVIAYCQ